uniref:Replication protein A 70 kDa DNA-binding subunit B/D first OB fold domain-containing protein n=1 Tax=Daucus carota subsp. sativus TaxID=79200 RepID=A0A165YUZ5_DAUCS
MSSKKCDSFKDVNKVRYDWKVTARVMNLWRGVSTKGEPFTSFNLLLLDNKRCRVHAFVPGSVAASLEPILQIGKIYLFNNFTAKDYKADEKFRPVHKTWQIVLGQETKITCLDENEVAIDKAAFDFYDLADLKDLANQSTYLTDVIGVVHEREIQLGDIKNRFGVQQRQIKITITDGRFEICCMASDATGSIPIMLDNFSAMKCFGKRAYDVYNKGNEAFPEIIKSLEKNLYTVKILITIHNITGRNKVYTVKDMVPGHIVKTEASESEDTTPKPVQESFAEVKI